MIIEYLKKYQNILITSLSNVRFLSDFSGSNAYVLKIKNKYYFFTDSRYYDLWKNKLEEKGFIVVNLKTDIFQAIKNIIKDEPVKKLYFESYNINYNNYNNLQNILNKYNVKLIPIKQDTIRKIKSNEQIQNIKQALNIAEQGFLYILSFLKEGLSEKDIAIELEYFLLLKGAEKLSFDSIIAINENTSYPHYGVGYNKLKNGSILLMDFGVKYNGICSDITRTIIFNKNKFDNFDEFKNNYNKVLMSNDLVFESFNLENTKKAKQIDNISRNYLKKYNLDVYFTHGLGHGVGYNIHEYPAISPKSNDIIEENMCFTIEPGIYFPGKYGIRIENMALVKNNKLIKLNKSTDKLITI